MTSSVGRLACTWRSSASKRSSISCGSSSLWSCALTSDDEETAPEGSAGMLCRTVAMLHYRPDAFSSRAARTPAQPDSRPEAGPAAPPPRDPRSMIRFYDSSRETMTKPMKPAKKKTPAAGKQPRSATPGFPRRARASAAGPRTAFAPATSGSTPLTLNPSRQATIRPRCSRWPTAAACSSAQRSTAPRRRSLSVSSPAKRSTRTLAQAA